MKSWLESVVLPGVFYFAACSTSAGLINQPDVTVYDTDRDIFWISDPAFASYNNFGIPVSAASTPGTGEIGSSGLMDWGTAMNWIAAMNADGGTGFLGFDNWRLPFTLQPDPACSWQGSVGPYSVSADYNCTGSEMGHLFYSELAGTALSPIAASGDPDLALFAGFGSSWSGTEAVFNPVSSAWKFDFSSGGLGTADKATGLHLAWAVRDNIVATVHPVSIPATGWLLVGAVCAFRCSRRRTAGFHACRLGQGSGRRNGIHPFAYFRR